MKWKIGPHQFSTTWGLECSIYYKSAISKKLWEKGSLATN